MEIKFIEVNPGHIELVVPMIKEFYLLEKISFDDNKVRAALSQFIQNPTYGRAWLIIADNEVAGYIIFTFGFCLEFGGRDAFIDEIYLKAPFRQLGIGKRAIDFLSEFAEEQEIKVILLEVDHENKAAQEVYKKRNFIPREKYFLMTKHLS